MEEQCKDRNSGQLLLPEALRKVGLLQLEAVDDCSKGCEAAWFSGFPAL